MLNVLYQLYANWFSSETGPNERLQIQPQPQPQPQPNTSTALLNANIGKITGHANNCGVHCILHFIHDGLLKGTLDNYLATPNYQLLLAKIQQHTFNGKTAVKWQDIKQFLRQNPNPIEHEYLFGKAYRHFLCEILNQDANYKEAKLIAYFIPDVIVQALESQSSLSKTHPYFEFLNQQIIEFNSSKQTIEQFLTTQEQVITTYWQNFGFYQFIEQLKGNSMLSSDELTNCAQALSIKLDIYYGQQFQLISNNLNSCETTLGPLNLINLHHNHFEWLIENSTVANKHNQYYQQPRPNKSQLLTKVKDYTLAFPQSSNPVLVNATAVAIEPLTSRKNKQLKQAALRTQKPTGKVDKAKNKKKPS